MDGKGHCIDNVFIERLWRSVKYEEVYLHAYANGTEARTSLTRYFSSYNTVRLSQSLEYRTPDDVFSRRARRLDAGGRLRRTLVNAQRLGSSISGDSEVAGALRSRLPRLPMRSLFPTTLQNPELLTPSASDCAARRPLTKSEEEETIIINHRGQIHLS